MDDQLSHGQGNTGRPAPQSHSYAPARPRKHMGVASSDPTYLPPVNNPHAPSPDREVRVPTRKTSLGRGGSAQGGTVASGGGYIPPTSPTLQVRSRGNESVPNANRGYISQPKRGKSIFTSRVDRQRKRLQIALVLMIVAAVILALVWFFFLRG